MVLESLPEELAEAKKLMREGKYEEALGTIKLFQNKSGISDDKMLTALILEGRLYTYTNNPQDIVKIGEVVYDLSQKLGNIPGVIEALLFKSHTANLGNLDEALDISQEADNLIVSFEKETSSELVREKAANLSRKGWIYYIKGDYNKALEFALLSLSLRERLGKKMGIANTYGLIAGIYTTKGEPDSAKDFIQKSLELMKEMKYPAGIASILTVMGSFHDAKGNIDQAMHFYNQAISFKELDDNQRFVATSYIGNIYGVKGELDQALKYHKQALALSEALNYKHINVALNWVNLGNIYRMKGDYDQAIEFLKRILESSNELNLTYYLRISLFWLVLINLDKGLREEAQQYLSRLKELSNETESERFFQTHQVARAIVLKSSGRTRNRAEAEDLLKQIVEGEVIDPEIYKLALVSLCEFLLEELESSNDPDVMNEINPVITRLLEIAESQRSYSLIAETNLLQGRLALMRLNLDDARHFLTTAQKIADEHGLTLLAQKISQEHDGLLEELETWQSFKKTKASISKRMKLAAVDGIMERMLGKRAVEPPAIVEEKPIMLLIMDNSGNTFFNHSFSKDWNYDDLFSSFMSAFNTFSSEIFSKSIDRIKIDENVILINPIDPFLVCYVIKGQSYTALKKLNNFSEVIRNSADIWDSLNKSVITSEMLDLNNPPSLGIIVNEIFSQ